MNIFSTTFMTMVFLCIAATISHGQENNLQTKLDEYLIAQARNKRFYGSVLVAKSGRIILSKGYGMANIDEKEPNTPDTKYRIASITKSFTCIALMQLQERGVLNVGDKVSKYIPDYKFGDQMTVHQVMKHIAGIPDFLQFPEYWERIRTYCPVQDAYALFKDKPLDFTPGEQWGYSNSGYVLLGYIIEKVSGMSYEAYLQKNIFDPLNMTNSGFESDQEINEIGATGYMSIMAQDTAYHLNMSINHAAGALYSTVEDMYLFDRALNTEKLVSNESLEKIFTPGLQAYGYGWGITDSRRVEKKMHFMNGRFNGFVGNITRYPDDDVCIIALSNYMDVNLQTITDDLAAIIFDKSYKTPKIRKPISMDSKNLTRYLGTYTFDQGIVITIILENDKLYRTMANQQRVELIPESHTHFYYADRDVEVVFVTNREGNVESMILNLPDGSEIVGSRIN